LFDADPRFNPGATLIRETRVDNPQLDAVAGGSASGLGLGGMVTKVRAARLAARSGTATVIASGRQDQVIDAISRGQDAGTLLIPVQEPQAARKRWLAGQLQPRGILTLDEGAVRVLREKGSSLLAVGVCGVKGHFARGEAVTCQDRAGSEVARGLVNYNTQETLKIAGQPSHRIEEILGYVDEDELIHRDNLVLL
jgi:glutamate 5-kinase